MLQIGGARITTRKRYTNECDFDKNDRVCRSFSHSEFTTTTCVWSGEVTCHKLAGNGVVGIEAIAGHACYLFVGGCSHLYSGQHIVRLDSSRAENFPCKPQISSYVSRA